jgi:NADH dehydrogenase FAD-containing subunit
LSTHACRLLDRLPEKAGEAAKQWLESKGVQVLLGQRVVELEKARPPPQSTTNDCKDWCTSDNSMYCQHCFIANAKVMASLPG